jgi:hypothetical protein
MNAVLRCAWIAIAILFGAAIVVLLALGSGAQAWFETRDAKLGSVRTVGIISAVGEQFTWGRAGLTGLDTGTRRVSVAHWGLDDLIVQQVTDALKARFEVRSVSYSRAAFAELRESAIVGANLVRGDPVKDLLRHDVTPQGLDAYVVITKATANFGGGVRKLEGIGLVSYSTLFDSFNLLHALYEVRVVDGRTFDIIEKLAAGPADGASSVRLAGPSLVTDAAGDVQDEHLRSGLVDLLGRSLPQTLRDLHLVDQSAAAK